MDTKEYWLNGTRERIAEAHNLLGPLDSSMEVSREDVRQVAVILGSSRSGSSFLFSSLSESGGVWAPQGEETPFYRLHDLGWVDGVRQSDALLAPWSMRTLDHAASSLLADVGRASPSFDRAVFMRQAAARLLMQWPVLELSPRAVVDSLRVWIEKDPSLRWSNWLASLGIDTQLYALDGFAARSARGFDFPDLFLEEPPFVAQIPRRAPRAADLHEGILLLKTSSNAYRIPFLRALFPRAEFRWILLARNPAASINGLMDGWTSGAFHSHDVGRFCPLEISGYSELYPHGENWWKFDLPPDWSDFAREDLAGVCAFQWMSAYENILAQMGATEDPVLRVKCEHLTAPHTREAEFAKVFKFLGMDPPRKPPAAERPVMASQTPRPARWRARSEEILPQLERASVIDLAAKLHYDLESDEDLV